jgi:hypothetical protein
MPLRPQLLTVCKPATNINKLSVILMIQLEPFNVDLDQPLHPGHPYEKSSGFFKSMLQEGQTAPPGGGCVCEMFAQTM